MNKNSRKIILICACAIAAIGLLTTTLLIANAKPHDKADDIDTESEVLADDIEMVAPRGEVEELSLSYTLDDEGNVVVDVSAVNNTGTAIESITLGVVLKDENGEVIPEETTGETALEIVANGPVESGQAFTLTGEVIGQCKDLKEINVHKLTIAYSDGMFEMIDYYYSTK